MRISDWSSDVCSSDLLVQTDLLALDLACVAGHEARRAQLALERLVVLDQRAGDAQVDRTGLAGGAAAAGGDEDVEARGVLGQLERLAHEGRKSVVVEKRVSVRVELGGRRVLQQQNKGSWR